MVRRLQSDPAWETRIDALVNDLLDHPELRGFIEPLWTDLKTTLRSQAVDDGSELRRRLAVGMVSNV